MRCNKNNALAQVCNQSPVSGHFSLHKKIVFLLTYFSDWYNITIAVAQATLDICDSGVVGNARPCQGRDRGFEPRLSLFLIETRKSIIKTFGFCFLSITLQKQLFLKILWLSELYRLLLLHHMDEPHL